MINLLPYKQKKMMHTSHQIQMALIVTTGLFFVFIITLILLSPTFIFVNSKLTQIEKLSVFLGEGDMDKLNTSISVLQNKVSSIDSKLADNSVTDPLGNINIIMEQVSKGISVNSYSVSDSHQKAVSISGISNTRSDLEKFTQALKNIPGVSLVDSPISNFVKNTNNDFSITVVFKK